MTRSRLLLAFALAGTALACGANAARAAESAPVRSVRATAVLVSDVDTLAAEHRIHVGLRLLLAPGWHTYWRNPGDAGAATQIELTLPPGLASGGIAWPAPDRQPEGPLMTYGYSGEVLLPIPIDVAAVDKPAQIQAHATWLVCANICVPEEGTFALTLPPAQAGAAPAQAAAAPLFRAAEQRQPRPLPWSATIAPDGVLALRGGELSAASVREAWFVPSAWGAIRDTAPQTLRVGPGALTLALAPGPEFKPDIALEGVVSLRDAGGILTSYDVSAMPGAAPRLETAGSSVGWGGAARLAFLGGLLLNLMPCVFPVLAMKAAGLARIAEARDRAWRHGLAYAGGVLASFAVLAGLLMAARAGGSAIGWGVQFQSPAFVAATTWVLFAIGLNLSGVYAVEGGGRFGRVGAGRGGLAGDALTGILAVVVATPCTAPFMAAAVGAALVLPALATLGVMLAMGLGLAAPYLVLTCVPGAARLLPRPGAWMEVLRQALAFPMYAACVWLAWVMSLQSGPDGVLLIAGGLVAVAGAAWVLRLAQRSGSAAGQRLATGMLAATVAGLALGLSRVEAQPPATPLRMVSGETFSLTRLAALRAEGRPVFVDMTAAWCVTCLVNERVALAPEQVRAAFATRRVVTLTGDWTRQDPEITGFLRQHDSAGVPLYLYYPAGAADPIRLPQLLTPGIVLASLEAPHS